MKPNTMVAKVCIKATSMLWFCNSACTNLFKGQYFNLLLTDITYAELLTAQPFSNTVDVIELQGKHLLETLEFSVSRVYGLYRGNGRHKRDIEATEFSGQGFLQMSGKSCSVLSPKKTSDSFQCIANKFRLWIFHIVTTCGSCMWIS
jgi:hypothetical protein